MLTAFMAALALFSAPKTVHKTDHQVAGWTVTVRSDRFTGGVSCKARRGHVSLQGPVAVFALGEDVDSTDALYRIDLGPAHPASEVAFRLRTLGAPVMDEPVQNPSRGLVVLPLADVTEASKVWIRAEPRAGAHSFSLMGIKQALAYEASSGCA